MTFSIGNLLTLIWISFNNVKPGRVSDINLCSIRYLRRKLSDMSMVCELVLSLSFVDILNKCEELKNEMNLHDLV